jgi:hypothetical protein
MPEPITIVQAETPALSPENVEMLQAMEAQESDGEEAPLLAGKYKSVEELEKAYKALQSKLGQPKQPAEVDNEVDNTDAETDTSETDTDTSDTRSAKEIYGEAIGTKLEEAGIDFSDMNTRWQQSGELSTDDYTALEGAGFSKQMVEAYLNGLNYQAAKDSALTMQQVADVKSQFGGEEEYGRMMAWAQSNLSAEEQDAFNTLINTQPMSTVKLAVAGIHSRYTAAEGREPKLLGGRSPRSEGDVFESTAQLVEAMKDPKYKSDPAYRRKVEAKLSRSSIL